MIQVNTLKAAGISEQEIRQLETALEALQTAKNQACHQAPHIVCTGIYNAGKSTLLNSLAGKEIFPTGDIPTTKKSAQAEFSGAVYIDTPGLNVMEDDDRETQAAYETADFILFVANAQNGGVSAAEAMWLQKLKERYGSLQQRLIFALTHSAQVDPEQLPGIRDKVCGNLSKAVGFAPEKILCVDSIAYQDGVADNELLLIENSGIPQLQAYLSECVAAARETLQKARKADVTKRRQDILGQIEKIRNGLKNKVDTAAEAGKKQIAVLDRIWAEFDQKLASAMPKTDISPIFARFLDLGFDCCSDIHDRSQSSLKRQMRSYLRPYYDKRREVVQDEVNRVMDDLRSYYRYCDQGLDSEYARYRNQSNTVFEQWILNLQKQGVPVSMKQDISAAIELPSDLETQVRNTLLKNVVQSDGSYSFSSYLDRFHTPQGMTEYVSGFLGIQKEVTIYTAYGIDMQNEIVYRMREDLQRKYESNVNRANSLLNRYWKRFFEALTKEAELQKSALKQQVDAYKATLMQSFEFSGSQDALTYMDSLRKEVTQ